MNCWRRTALPVQSNRINPFIGLRQPTSDTPMETQSWFPKLGACLSTICNAGRTCRPSQKVSVCWPGTLSNAILPGQFRTPPSHPGVVLKHRSLPSPKKPLGLTA
ncbi:WSC domain-containing protein [Histoplasma ohiense]|nr:WSC domain-containing protein [Histoplasma ohiense (nom. inval.)]